MSLQNKLETKDDKIVTDQQLAAILDAINGVRFGSITLIIQDGKLVQIDKNEKTRLK